MTDIVERLRSVEFADVGPKYLMWEAADEIERLRFSWAALGHEIEIADNEIERLKAENEQLRATAVQQAGIMHRFGDKPDAAG